MKNSMNKLMLFAIAVAIVFYACQKKEKSALLEGKILNSDIKYVLLKSTEDEDAIADTALLENDGSFHFNLKLIEPQFYLLRISNQLILEVFISPGDKLKLEPDMNKPFDQITFSGKGEKVNNYMFRHLMSDEYLLPDRQTLFQMNEGDFVSILEKAFEQKNKNLDSFYNENKKEVGEKFFKIYRTNLLYEYALTMLSYKQRYPYFTNQPDYKFSSDFDDYLKKIDLNNPENLISSSFRSFLLRYIDVKVDPIFEKDTNAQQSESGYCSMRYEMVKKTYKNQQILDYVIYQILTEQVKYYGIKEIEALFSHFKKDCKTERYKKSIESEIAKWDAIKPGKTAPGFSYPDMDGNLVSLSQFSGKVIYLDVWATWCGPCKRESPYFKQLALDYKGKNIVFIQVSVDDTEAELKDYLKEIPENTYQLYAGGWKSSITIDYLINSIPRFLLIGKDGKIIDNNAPRPSDKKIRELLDGLLDIN